MRPCPYDARGPAPFPPGVWACPHSRPREPGRALRTGEGPGRPDPLREPTGERLASVELKLREVASVRPRSRRTQRRRREDRPDTQATVDRAQRQRGRTPHTHPPVRHPRRLPVAAPVQHRLSASVATADVEARRRGARRAVPRRVSGPQTPPGTTRASAWGRACAGSPHGRGDIASRAIPSRSPAPPIADGPSPPGVRVVSGRWGDAGDEHVVHLDDQETSASSILMIMYS